MELYGQHGVGSAIRAAGLAPGATGLIVWTESLAGREIERRVPGRASPKNDDANRGLIDADLGSGLIKQRIARPGASKSGGFRTIVLFRSRERAFFVHGFAKNEKDNIGDDETIP